MGLLDGFFSLSSPVNKISSPDSLDRKEGQVSDALPELELPMSDEELLALKKKWEKEWASYEPKISKKQSENEKYYLGKYHEQNRDYVSYDDKPVSDNLMFQALETFLPLATKEKPEPVVVAEGKEGTAFANAVHTMLIYQMDRLKMKLKMMKATRFWALYLLGVAKVGWSGKQNDIAVNIIRPQKLILDPNAWVEDGEYNGEYIGELRRDTVSMLLIKFPKAKKAFAEYEGREGTIIQYTEWWTADYTFFTYKSFVLAKYKNPHWNYDTEAEITMPDGSTETVTKKAYNHFNARKMPYVFLSVFNLGKEPFDVTSLIGQNICLQDLIDKRIKQIDRNADNTNGGIAVSGNNFTKEQAARVAEARKKGATIWVPNGDVTTAIQQLQGPPLPGFIYQSLIDYRTELQNIFGVRGSIGAQTGVEKTVRGKVMAKQGDSDRIGGGISVFLEQFADDIYNWMVQLMAVYYDEEHEAPLLGPDKAVTFEKLKSSDFKQKLMVSVKGGSMIPKDPMVKRNEAVDLFQAGAIDPITLFERLEDPNPKESALRLFLWKTNPMIMFPEAQQAIAMAQAGAKQGAAPHPSGRMPEGPINQTPEANPPPPVQAQQQAPSSMPPMPTINQ